MFQGGMLVVANPITATLATTVLILVFVQRRFLSSKPLLIVMDMLLPGSHCHARSGIGGHHCSVIKTSATGNGAHFFANGGQGVIVVVPNGFWIGRIPTAHFAVGVLPC